MITRFILLMALVVRLEGSFEGQWALEMSNGDAGWLSLKKGADAWQGELWVVGQGKKLQKFSEEDECLVFFKSLRVGPSEFPGGPPTGKRLPCRHEIRLKGNGIEVETIFPEESGRNGSQIHLGKRLPAMPPRPDLSVVRFGSETSLFNGQDLAGWVLTNDEQINGWKAADSELVNETPKISFDPFSKYGNLRTIQKFGDGKLTIEFNVPKGGNSGIYLRGAYEVQVVDRESKMQGINGVGAVFGRVEPTENAGREGGEWQKYEITIVDRHATVVLNGVTVIDNEPVIGNTNGAYQSDITKAGPLFLQGDHTAVKYRNITFRPVIEKLKADDKNPTKNFSEWDKNQDGMVRKDELPEEYRGDFAWADLDDNGDWSLEEVRQFSIYWPRMESGKARLPEGVTVLEDVPYVKDGHERQKLDLYLPKDGGTKRPLVVWIHGGGWKTGTKEVLKGQERLLEKGFVLASINYRLSSHALFPAQLHDCKAALRFLRSHAESYGIDGVRIGVWGSSAGGHLASLIATSGNVEELEGDIGTTGVSSSVQAGVMYFGPTDLVAAGKEEQALKEGSALRRLLGGLAGEEKLALARQASPIAHIDPEDPPMLTLQGTADPLVPAWQAERFHAKLLESGVDSQLMIQEGAGHAFFDGEQELAAVVAFFEKTLKE
ncbi:MAG: alpha/beta fold hydrolase [Roseibacillus sp.]